MAVSPKVLTPEFVKKFRKELEEKILGKESLVFHDNVASIDMTLPLGIGNLSIFEEYVRSFISICGFEDVRMSSRNPNDRAVDIVASFDAPSNDGVSASFGFLKEVEDKIDAEVEGARKALAQAFGNDTGLDTHNLKVRVLKDEYDLDSDLTKLVVDYFRALYRLAGWADVDYDSEKRIMTLMLPGGGR